jgi:hypothetical protein
LLRGDLSLWEVYGPATRSKSEAMRPTDARGALRGAPVVARGAEGLTDEQLGTLRGLELDFILWLGAAAPRGPILAIPRHGVWRFQHGDAAGYLEAPCLREMDRGASVAGASLLRVPAEDAASARPGGVVLRSGFFGVAPQSYAKTLDQVYLGSALFPADACRAILAGGPEERAPVEPLASPRAAPPKAAPSNRELAPQIARIAGELLAAHVRTLLLSEQWNVGVVESPIDAFVQPGFVPEVRWLPTHGRHRYLADPFGVRRGAGQPLTVLVEDYDHATERAYIAFVEERADGSFSEPRPAIDLPIHLSYPYLFFHGGEVYCLPAAEEAREVRLYRARKFPGEWEQVAVLVAGFAAADATLFEHEGRFWLLFNDHDTGSWTRLHAFHAPALLGPWEPHAANPIKTDVRSARGAGTPFRVDGQLYRPAQDCSRAYGGAVTINRVLRLTPTEFAEETARVVGPDPRGPFPAGLHTISSMGDATLIDAKRLVFVGAAFRRELSRKLKSALARVRG